jgi:hypothetical protein
MTGKRAGVDRARSILLMYERGKASTPAIKEQNLRKSRRETPCCTAASWILVSGMKTSFSQNGKIWMICFVICFTIWMVFVIFVSITVAKSPQLYNYDISYFNHMNLLALSELWDWSKIPRFCPLIMAVHNILDEYFQINST